jgi:hypothetical protein
MATIHPVSTAMASPLAKGRIRKQIEPYLQDLALVVASWNELHDELGRLFSIVIGGGNLSLALAVWHTIESDALQRKLIRAALPFSLSDLPRAKEKGADWVRIARDEIKWILDRVDSLRDQRNDAVHSPLIAELQSGKWKLTSFTFFGHPRAKKLAGKELLSQFRWYWKTSQVLAAYTQSVRLGLYAQPYSWPKRPSLPLLQPIRKPRPRKTAT